MSNRFWVLTRRQTIVAFGIAMLVGVALALVLPRGENSTSRARSRHALWAFGFATVRLDPTTLRPSSDPLPRGFGSVLSTPGRVYLFEPTRGRVGLLDASRNTLKTIGRIPSGVGEPVGVDPLIAWTAGQLWLVSRPGTIRSFDLSTRRAGEPIELSAASPDLPTTTRVIRTGEKVLAISEVQGGYLLSRIETTRETAEETSLLPTDGPITGLTADGRAVWILTSTTATRVDATTLRATTRIALPPSPSLVPRGAAVSRGALWTLAENGSTLVRVDLASEQTTTALRILPEAPPAFRGPASVVAGDGRVWAMVQRTNDPEDRRVRIAGVNAGTGQPTTGADLPSELFIGAIAVT